MGGSSALRRLSKAGFGNKYRLEVGAAIHRYEGADFTAMSLYGDTGIFYQRVHQVLKGFEMAAMIIPTGIEGEGVERPYKAEASGYWRCCFDVATDLGWTPR